MVPFVLRRANEDERRQQSQDTVGVDEGQMRTKDGNNPRILWVSMMVIRDKAVFGYFNFIEGTLNEEKVVHISDPTMRKSTTKSLRLKDI